MNDIQKILIIPEFSRFSRKNLKINDIAAGSCHTMILAQPYRFDPKSEKEERSVWVMGEAQMLGDPDITTDQYKPCQVGIPAIEESKGKSGKGARIKFIYSAYNKCVVVDDQNQVSLWGMGFDKLKIREPEVFFNFEDKEIKKLSFSPMHGLALVGEGELFAWGDGTYGELGDPLIEHSDLKFTPKEVSFFKDNNIKVKTMSCGLRHSVVVGQ